MQQSELKKEPIVDLIQVSHVLDNNERRYRNITVSSSGGIIDLSPCGTGTRAKMALFYSKGELSLGEIIIYEGLNGEQFKGRLVEKKEAGSYQAVVPEVSGITSTTGHNLIIEAIEDLV